MGLGLDPTVPDGVGVGVASGDGVGGGAALGGAVGVGVAAAGGDWWAVPFVVGAVVLMATAVGVAGAGVAGAVAPEHATTSAVSRTTSGRFAGLNCASRSLRARLGPGEAVRRRKGIKVH